MILEAVLLVSQAVQISTPAIVARVKEGESHLKDLQADATLEITRGDETQTRRFRLTLKREGVNYRALIALEQPASMAGTQFLVVAERGRRNKQWAYFPDLDLVRSIPGKEQDASFLGSDITYADLAGGAHLDDLTHDLVGEDVVDGADCYVLEGTPRHKIAYGKLRGWIRKDDFVNVKAQFYDVEDVLLKEAMLSDVRVLEKDVRLAHRIEVRSLLEDRSTVLVLDNVLVNQGLSMDSFTESALGRKE